MAKNIQSMRLFLALIPGKAAIRELVSIQKTLIQSGASGNFTREANLHLTLRFLGDTLPDDIENIASAMRLAVTEQFDICLDNIGMFKSGIVFAGLNSEKLLPLHEKLERALSSFGWQKDRQPFNAHITLLRKANLKGGLPEISVNPCRWTAKEIVLMQSTRVSDILTYVPICKQQLK